MNTEYEYALGQNICTMKSCLYSPPHPAKNFLKNLNLPLYKQAPLWYSLNKNSSC